MRCADAFFIYEIRKPALVSEVFKLTFVEESAIFGLFLIVWGKD